MSKRVLIIGPSGTGKTYISAALRKKGINAVDADLIEGLSGWYDGEGRKVDFPIDAGRGFLDNHRFLWKREFLEKFLQDQSEIYLFGFSGNAFDMIDLFNEVYFLKAQPEVITERLRHGSRKNPMGKTEYQLKNALKYAKEIEETVRRRDIKMINADQSPEKIFLQITKEDANL